MCRGGAGTSASIWKAVPVRLAAPAGGTAEDRRLLMSRATIVQRALAPASPSCVPLSKQECHLVDTVALESDGALPAISGRV